jgi:outer membrane protein assembly factor BamB
MRILLCAILTAALIIPAAALRADDKVEAKGEKVVYTSHDGHFVKNTYELKGDSGYVAVADKDEFDKIFGVAAVGGKKFNWVPKDAFDKKIVVAAMKKGAALAEFKIEKVTADGDTLYVQYTADTKGSATGTATYVSPMIIAVDKAKIKTVIFIENGKKAATVDLKKGS